MASEDAHNKGRTRRRRDKGGDKQAGQAKPRRIKKSDVEDGEVKRLQAAIDAGKPAPGTNPLSVTAPVPEGGYVGATTFEELPLSRYTKEGLNQNKFVTLTTIQRAALPHALAGRDILGAAKTGSGKTLAFLIPLVEKLYRARWTRLDGLGALVLTPTRELALQIFQELRKVGSQHELSAGLLIGGKNVKEEQASINRMNILVCTPGRLLQHMDETPGFDASNVQMLVLDEADRLLDMGFAPTLDAILDALPTQRQTMLFSATQTKSVKDLARLSLVDPEYLSVHEASDTATPLKLEQAVAVVEAPQKMDTLWSFIKTHLATKTIVFLSTCKQVRFFHEVFKKLRPGVPLRALHGGMKQMKRMITFQEFCQAEHMVLFATDIAGRGLDFPSVDWVVQVDCPEDAAAYIHRVGRTARYLAAGRALLMLTPSESEGMRTALAGAKIPIKSIKINPSKQQSIGPALQALLSKSTQLKEWGQRALVAYVRSVFLAPTKDVFRVEALPLEALAASWGLSAAPRMRFLKKVGGKKQVVTELGGGEAGGDDDQVEEQAGSRKAGKKQQQAAQSEHDDDDDEDDDDDGGSGSDGDDDEQQQRAGGGAAKKGGAVLDKLTGAADADDDFLVVKKRNVFSDEQAAAAADEQEAGAELGAGSSKKKRLKIKVGRTTGQRVVFDADGQALQPLAALAADPDFLRRDGSGEEDGQVDKDGVYVVAEQPEARFSQAAQLMKQRDQTDKARLKQLKAQLKSERKARRKAALAGEDGFEPRAQLGRAGDSDEEMDSAGSDLGSASSLEQDGGSDDDSFSGASSEDEPERPPVSSKRAGGAGASAKPAKRAKHEASSGLSLQEQEALVLARISANRK